MSIKELNEFCMLHNLSVIVHNGKLSGFRRYDYVAKENQEKR